MLRSARTRTHWMQTVGGLALGTLFLMILGCAGSPSQHTSALPGEGADVGKTVLYRDTWGVAHIYAPTVEDGLFAQGYAQAQDRPEQLLMNFKMAMGEFASIAGAEQVPIDLLSLLFDHYGNAKTLVSALDEQSLARLQAYSDGINAFYAQHPADVPAWWNHAAVTPAMVDAFGRLFLYNWSVDEAIEDLTRGGVQPTFMRAQRGSNQWAVAPQRSASGHALLLIDPHLSWWGPSRFWEFRVHAGDWHGSGVGLAGSPYIGLGHNNHLAWAMTTGGPDTADVFELTLNPENPDQYLFDDEWRDLSSRTVVLKVAGSEDQEHVLEFSHHGPLLARTSDKAYAAKLPYNETTNRNRAWEILNFGESYTAVAEAAATQAFFPQNIMAADTQGNIYYQRVGGVPKRNPDYDWSRPVDGSISATKWQGLHPSTDHLHLLNPESGYMQNCNIPPDAMIKGGAFDPDDYPDYLYAGSGYGPSRSGWSNLRGSRALQLLAADNSVTVNEALAYAVDVTPYGSERWLRAFAQAAADPNEDEQALLQWDRRLTKDSTGALRYAMWRMALDKHPLGAGIRSAIDDLYAPVEGRPSKRVRLNGSQQQALRQTYAQAMQALIATHGTAEVAYGEVFRVGRDEKSWPVGGGGGDEFGLTTLRAMGFNKKPNEEHQRLGNRGQTSTQVVHLSTPIESWMFLPVGNSDRKNSPHYTDQAQGPFSDRKLKPTWWQPTQLKDHIESRTVLRPEGRN